MASTKEEKKAAKKEKKRSEADGVAKSSKKDKKEKKEKKEKLKNAVNAALDDELQANLAASSEPADAVTKQEEEKKSIVQIAGAMVPFARPLADEKATKKILKGVRKGTVGFVSAPFALVAVIICWILFQTAEIYR